MLKRTKGRLLISLLVITGLAGTLNTSTLSQKERKQAVQLMKSTRNEVVASVTGLSDAQLDFKSPKNSRSIREVMYALSTLETSFSKEMKSLMSQTSESEKRLLIQQEDAQILNTELPPLQAITYSTFADMDEAGQQFISLRNEHIRYLRTSTEDLRNHVINSRLGWVDGYQKYLLHIKSTQQLIFEIRQIKSSPGFPKGK